jgi:uncharacterized glyoxalase superfamily protein PhnB
MSKLTSCAPVLLVKDIPEAVEYYREKLGFEYGEMYGDPPAFAICARDGFDIMFSKAPPEAVIPNWKVVDKIWNVYYRVDDAEALYKELIERGAKIDYTLYKTPYNMLEFGINDINGYDIAFGQIL